MVFHVGDAVMHWFHGFGHVVGIEERVISDQEARYYAVSIGDLTVWVPADDQVESRLRFPTTREGFQELFAILTGSSDPLPVDRQERKLALVEKMKDGQAASFCHVLRDLAAFQETHALNDNDQILWRRARTMLLGEWAYAFSIPLSSAETELRRMLVVENSREVRKR